MKVVHVVSRRIDKLSTQLVECAQNVADAITQEEGQLDQTIQEDTEILRRDWSSQVRHSCKRVQFSGSLISSTRMPVFRFTC